MKNHKALAIVSMSATILIAIGAFLPWVVEDFSPPQGYALIEGVRYYALTSILTALNGGFPFMGTALTAMIFSNLFFDLPSLFITDEGVNRILDLLSAPIAGVATGIQCVGALGLTLLAVIGGKASLGRSPDESLSQHIAEQFIHVSLGPGFYFMVIGFVAALIVASMSAGWKVARIILLVVFVLFACGALGAISTVLQFLGNIDPLRLLGIG